MFSSLLAFLKLGSSRKAAMLILSLLVAGNFCPPKGKAQTDTLKLTEVVVEAKKESAAADFQIDTFLAQNASTSDLSRLLAINSPIFVKNYGRGQLATVTFRGTSASHTQVWWQGIPLNQAGSGQVDFSVLPAFLFDKVAVQTGGQSLKTSNGGIGASISLDHSQRWKKGAKIGVEQSIGSFGTFQEVISLAGGHEKWQVSLKAYHLQSANNYRFTQHKPGGIEVSRKQENADFTRMGLLANVHYQLAKNQLLSISYWQQKMKRGLPEIRLNDANNRETRQNDDFQRLAFQWQWWREKAEWHLKTGYSASGLYFNQKMAISEKDKTLVDAENGEKLYISTLEGKGTFSPKWSWWAQIMANHSQIETADFGKQRLAIGRSELTQAGLLNRKLTDNLSVEGLYRFTFLKDSHTQGAFYRAGYLTFNRFLDKQKDYTAYVQLSHIVKVPTLNELYYFPGGNPDLQAEKSNQIALGFTKQPTGNLLKVGTSFQLYWLRVNNRIFWQPDFRGAWTPSNWAKAQSVGWEWKAHLSAVVWHGITMKADLGYAFTHAQASRNNTSLLPPSKGQLPYVPLHTGNLLLQLSRKNIWLLYSFDFASERSTTTDFSDGFLYKMPTYYMNDVQAGIKWPLNQKLTAKTHIQVNNLLNENYRAVSGRPMAGRYLEVTFLLEYE